MKRESDTARTSHDRGTRKRAEAEALFIDALQRSPGTERDKKRKCYGLPHRAFEELNKRKPSAVRAWAREWHVDAPCVRRFAVNWCAGKYQPGVVATSKREGRVPGVTWRYLWYDMNLDPIDGRCTDALANVQTDEDVRRWIEAQGDRITAGERTTLLRFVQEELPKLREKLLEQKVVTAPLAADPFHESLAAFLRRARNHWQGREKALKSLGLTAKTKTRDADLALHVEWLLRYQIHNEPIKMIAVREKKTRQLVAAAIKALKTLLELRN